MCENKGLCACGESATKWLWNTSASYCDKDSCRVNSEDSYKEHCKRVKEEIEFERMMDEEFGEWSY